MPKKLNREDTIFGIIIRAYVETAEPVGSRTISRHFDVGLSPASIRNVMADLEDQGLLKQPHTSAGRVPTDKGYRYYVDRLMEPEELSEKEKRYISSEFSKERDVEGVLECASKVISEITQNAALIYVKNLKRISFLSYLLEDLVREAERLNHLLEEQPELFIEGAFRILGQPEFQNASKMRTLLQEFEEKYYFLEVFLKDLEESGVHIHIGSENGRVGLGDVTLIVKDCYWGQTPIGSVAVAGPTRMHYPKNMAVLNYVADSVSECMKGF